MGFSSSKELNKSANHSNEAANDKGHTKNQTQPTIQDSDESITGKDQSETQAQNISANYFDLLTQKLLDLNGNQNLTAKHVIYHISEMQNKLSQFLSHIDHSNSELDSIDYLHTTLKKRKEERSRLLNKFSELAGDRLRNDNPEITDLSDPKRPSKLAEQFSELYDNEWTNAIDAFETDGVDDDEKEIIILLLQTLNKCYNMCVDMSKKQLQVISDLFLCKSIQAQDIPKSCKEYQKTTAESGVNYVKNQWKDEELKEYCTRIRKGAKMSHAAKKCYTTYVEKCLELLWYMRIQDPPVVVQFEGGNNPNQVFRAYTRSGPNLDYVVWPTLLLHEGGSILSRGVAQFCGKAVTST